MPLHQSVHAIAANAAAVVEPLYEGAYDDWLDGDLSTNNIPPEQVTILGQQERDYGGFVGVLAVLPDGESEIVTPKAPSVAYYITCPTNAKYTFISQCQATIPTTQNRTTIGVGELVNLSFTPALPTNAIWSASAGSLAFSNCVSNVFTAPSNAMITTVTATLANGQGLRSDFTVLQPSGMPIATLLSNWTSQIDPNISGVGQTLNVVILPTNVSFSRVQLMEFGEYPSGRYGYFANTNWTPGYLAHNMAAGSMNWFYLSADNSWFDDNCFYPAPNVPQCPWSQGGFYWDIPGYWKVGDSTLTSTLLTNWTQTFTIDSAGTMSVSKFRHSASRDTNNVYTNSPPY